MCAGVDIVKRKEIGKLRCPVNFFAVLLESLADVGKMFGNDLQSSPSAFRIGLRKDVKECLVHGRISESCKKGWTTTFLDGKEGACNGQS